MVITVDVIDNGALNLLQDLERLNLIRVNVSAESPVAPDSKLSRRFAGALHLSDKKYQAFQNALREGRTEWARDTY